MKNTPLVSIWILTYNSEKFILDALNGAKNQTYKKIELIVSDDCSKDDTVEICRKWLDANRSCFVNVHLLTSDHNTGTCANGNRALAVCNSQWIKVCAGDDMLLPNCIEDCVNYVQSHPEVSWLVGRLQQYKYSFKKENKIDFTTKIFFPTEWFDKSAEEQLKDIVYGNRILTPATFFKAKIVKDVGGYDEQFGILEDFPFFVKLLEHGIKCYAFDKVLIAQRVGDSNVFSNTEKLFVFRHQKADYKVRKEMCFKYYNRREILRCKERKAIYWLMEKLGLNKRNKFCIYVHIFLTGCASILTFDLQELCNYRGIFFNKLKKAINTVTKENQYK